MRLLLLLLRGGGGGAGVAAPPRALSRQRCRVCRVRAVPSGTRLILLSVHAARWRGARAAPLAALDAERDGRDEAQPSSSLSARREVDPRGYLVPRVGEVVIYPGRWPEQEHVGRVERVEFQRAHASWIVDVEPLKPVGPSLYARVGGAALLWFDVGRLRVCEDAFYDEAQRAWRVAQMVRDGYDYARYYTETTAGDEQAGAALRADGLAEYAALKQWMLGWTAVTGAAGTLYAALVFGRGSAGDGSAPLAFGVGALASVAYVWLLARRVDRIDHAGTTAASPPGGGERKRPLLDAERLLSLPLVRLLVPALAVLFLVWRHRTRDDTLDAAGVPVPVRELAAVVLGFLSYKVPLLYEAAREVLTTLRESRALSTSSSSPVPSTLSAALLRSLSGAVNVPRQAEQQRQQQQSARPIVVAGPSGVGKSTLIARLLAEFPGQLGFSVSSTTRAPRENELDGVDYHFLTDEQFRRDAAAGRFIEYAEIYGNLYGTSVDAVRAVTQTAGKWCLLDLDVQGVRAVRRLPELHAFFVWIAPPSFDALQERLRARGSDSEADITRRVAAARSEMEYAATSGVFDVSVVNDDVERAYDELKRTLWLHLGEEAR